jgi:hypothetical protein
LTRRPAAITAWQALIEHHPERILFGSDALAPPSKKEWAETRELYRALLDGLRPSTQAQVLTGNYDRIIGAAREHVRAFEKYVLTPTLYGKLNAVDGPRTVANWLQPFADTCFARHAVDRRGRALQHEACA